MKKEARLPHSLHNILQVVSLNAFEKVPIPRLLAGEPYTNIHTASSKQLTLWDL
jgi:hypothetical protein